MLKVHQHVPSRDWVLRKLAIRRGDLVLDLGSGNAPLPRADVLCDRFVDDDEQRPGQFMSAGKVVVVGDAHALPFRNGAVDYIFMSQLLEHVSDPGLCLAELMRVGKKGYIETPSELRERMFGWEFHRWIISVEENTLVLRPNDHQRLWGNTFYRLSASHKHWGHVYELEYDAFNVMVEWEGEIPYRIERSLASDLLPDDPYVPEQEKPALFGQRRDGVGDRWDDFKFGVSRLFPVRGVWRRAAFLLRGRRPPPALNDRSVGLLACPVCKGELAMEGEKLACACGRAYPIVAGVPRLLADVGDKA